MGSAILYTEVFSFQGVEIERSLCIERCFHFMGYRNRGASLYI